MKWNQKHWDDWAELLKMSNWDNDIVWEHIHDDPTEIGIQYNGRASANQI